jgi:hypothetical protein
MLAGVEMVDLIGYRTSNNSLHREFSSVRFYQASERYTDRDGLHRTVKIGLYIG